MAMNSVQFQHGLSMLEFFNAYGTQQQCEQLVRAWRWPAGFACPRCPVASSAGQRGHAKPSRGAISRRTGAPAHRRWMRGSYIGGCMVAGAFALLPGRYLGDLVWHHALWLV